MEIKKINILLLVKSNFHELLLTKEIQTRFTHCNVISVQSKTEAIRFMSTESVRGLVADIKIGVQENICDVRQIHLSKPDMPIVALVDDNTEVFLRKVLDVGVTEILQKDETFYVAVPKLLKEIFSREISDRQVDVVGRSLKQSEHLKLTSRTLSHEINNPLLTILSISELILDNKFLYDQELVNKIKVVHKSALRIQQTIHRMSYITTPVFQKTPVGEIIGPKKSRIYTKSKVKLS